MINSVCYVICCNNFCKESGNIKKNLSRCTECKKPLINLTLDILNKHYCPSGCNCELNCQLIHPTKKHSSPPYISPCADGSFCINKNCLFLHPYNGLWLVRG